MKKVLIPLIIVVIALSIVAYAAAISGIQTTGRRVNAEKQLLADGDMEASGVGDWSDGSGAVLTKQSGAKTDGTQILRVSIATSDTGGYAQQTILTSGKRYRINGWARGDGANGSGTIRSGAIFWTGTTSTDWQYFDVTFTAAAATIRLQTDGDNATTDVTEWDDVFITLDAGTVTMVEKQLWVDGDMETDGTGSWSLIAGSMTKETGAKEDGKQVLRSTNAGAASGRIRNAGPLTVGNTYRITGWARSDGTAPPRVYDGAIIIFAGTTSTEWQRIDVVFTATNAKPELRKHNVGAGNYAEFDNVFVTLDRGTVTNADQTLIPLASFTTTTGAWINSTDGNNRTWLEVVTAGLKSIESDQAYGTWIWRFNKQDASQMVNVPIASVNANWNNGSQDGYIFHIATTEMIRIFRVDSGSNESVLMQSSAGLFTAGVDYRVAITRDSSGEFTMYIKGGSEFPVWTLADSDAAGTNPATDNTHTSSNYFMIDGDAGDKLSEIQMYPNQVFTLAELQDHF
jgi:hypothetical protein